jgi:hypothetical protein
LFGKQPCANEQDKNAGPRNQQEEHTRRYDHGPTSDEEDFSKRTVMRSAVITLLETFAWPMGLEVSPAILQPLHPAGTSDRSCCRGDSHFPCICHARLPSDASPDEDERPRGGSPTVDLLSYHRSLHAMANENYLH